MSDTKFSSAKKDISITGTSGSRVNAKALLGSMTKDVGKRWKMVGIMAGVLLVMGATWMSTAGTGPKRQVRAADPVIDTTPKGISSEKNWKTATDAEMLALKQTLAQSQTTQKELLVRMEAMSKQMQQQQQPKTPPAGVGPSSNLQLTLPPPPTPPASLANPPAPPKDVVAPGAGYVSPAPAPSAPAVRSAARAFVPVSETAAADSDADAQKQTTTVDLVANERQGFLPAGSFADSTLISGVEAFTGGTAQAQPQPLVVRVDANAVLPNAAQYQIKGCHVLASVWGDMSSERVFGRLATLTCVDVNNKLVLSEEVEGVLVDSDGKNGIRGTLQDRQGAKLARSLLAGFAQGVASAFGAAQSTVTTTALGTTSSLIGMNAVRGGGYNGASTAAHQLADFYLKQAEATMPVIAVDAGRKVSVLFTKSKSLKFETTGGYRVKRKDKLTVERTY